MTWMSVCWCIATANQERVSDGMKKTIASATTGQCRGFNMYQMMVTMTIAAILLALALPAFDRFSVNGVLVTTTNDLSASLKQANPCAGEDS